MSFPPDKFNDFIPLFSHRNSLELQTDITPAATPRSRLLSPSSESRCQSILLVSPRPQLSSWPSFASTHSSTSTACSSTPTAFDTGKRVYKSKLTPEDFLHHAFGSVGAQSRQRNATIPSSLSKVTKKQESSIRPNVSPRPTSTKLKHRKSQNKGYSLPATPPSGTFSTTKPPKIKNSERTAAIPPLPSSALSVSQMDPFSGDLILPQKEGSWSNASRKREPLMTEEEWKEKARKRAESRKQRRMETQQGSLQIQVPLPIDIDWRPLEGSIGLPDPVSASTFTLQSPVNRKRATSHKGNDNPRIIGRKVKRDEQFDDELYESGAGLNKPKSMDNLDDLELRCSSLTLFETPSLT